VAFAAMLMAGLDGVQNKIDPGEPMDKNLYELPPEEQAKGLTFESPQVKNRIARGGLEAAVKALKEPAELALLEELEQRGPVIDSVLESGENLRRAFIEAARFGPAVDRFFTEIFVMVDDPALRMARLRLMKRLEDQILRIADISEIVSETE